MVSGQQITVNGRTTSACSARFAAMQGLICVRNCVDDMGRNCDAAREDAMKFVSVRELRSRTSQLWRDLAQERDLVVTNHGKPIAILSATDEDSLERSLAEIRRHRARDALRTIQRDAARRGLDRLSNEDIDAEIQATRRRRDSA
ncbi:MAG: type II toxin-antitoxin system Phd/YefM family antitoxin [Spirochaetaceae bacterium]|nr:type II toxin-antitoxin system Phd/YefM family antitoxin [Spirochaetaceae bacterium]